VVSNPGAQASKPSGEFMEDDDLEDVRLAEQVSALPAFFPAGCRAVALSPAAFSSHLPTPFRRCSACPQLHCFLADAMCALRGHGDDTASGGAHQGTDPEELQALLPVLSEFAAACCGSALSLEQRAFVTDLMEAAAARLLHCPPAAIPSEAPPVLLASRRFLECSLCALEHACSDSTGVHRPTALQIARGALAAILALTADGTPDASELGRALVARAERSASEAALPRFDELLASPPLQLALARRQAATEAVARGTGQSTGGTNALSAATAGADDGGGAADGGGGRLADDPLADALAALSPLAALAAEEGASTTFTAPAGGAPSQAAAPHMIGGSATALGTPRGDHTLFVRDVRRQNAEALLAAPVHGARRIASCLTQLLEPLELRQHLLSGSGSGAPVAHGGGGGGAGPTGSSALEEHLDAARPVFDLCAAAMQLLLCLPAASAARPGGGIELMRLLAALLGCFTLGSNLPTAERGASQALPQAASGKLHARAAARTHIAWPLACTPPPPPSPLACTPPPPPLLSSSHPPRPPGVSRRAVHSHAPPRG
jgi:hypothetical protein